MNEQQKLEILCAYLPHGVEVESDKIFKGFNTKLVAVNLSSSIADGFTISDAIRYDARPILRHPDDMTEEEMIQLGRILCGDATQRKEFAINDAKSWLRGTMKPVMSQETAQITTIYLHSIHIDTFGAIEAEFAVRKEVMNG